MDWITELRKRPFPLNLLMFFYACDFYPERFQFQSAVAEIAYPETAHCWGRRIGKTLTTSLTSQFLASIAGWRGVYLVPSAPQLESPNEYWLSNPFGDRVSADWLYCQGRKCINLAPMTNNNVRSKGFDFIVFDEQAALEKRQEGLLNVAKKMVQNSQHRHVVRISTPVINTQFEKDYLRLRDRGWAWKYNYQDVDQRRKWILPALEEIEEERKMVEDGHYPAWLFNQETLAEFSAMGGTIFSDYSQSTLNLYDPYSPEYIGIDVNPRYGHTAVITQLPNPGEIYVKEEIELGTDTEMAAEKIRLRARYNTHVAIELNGAGIEVYKTFQKHFKRKGFLGKLTSYTIDDQVRANRVMQLLRFHTIINPQAKQFFTQFKGAQWDPNKKMMPLKGPEDHWIDAWYVGNQQWMNEVRVGGIAHS